MSLGLIYDWVNKQTYCLIAKQDKVRQKSQPENDEMRKGRVRGETSVAEEGGCVQNEVTSHELHDST